MRKKGAATALWGAVALMLASGAGAAKTVSTSGGLMARAPFKPNASPAATIYLGQLESVGPSKRSLRIGYFGQWGGKICPAIGPMPTVTESATSVTIAIRQQVPTWANCMVDPFSTHPYGSLVVKLAAPIAGRSVQGVTLSNGAFSHFDRRFLDTSPSTAFPLRIHSVIGLSPADAYAMLTKDNSAEYCDPFSHRCGLPTRVVRIVWQHASRSVGPLPVVVGQQPAPGTVIRQQGSRVVLIVAPAWPPCGRASCPYGYGVRAMQ